MINNPVSQFEEALRRATRRKGSDDQIKEVASHYDDLYSEALNKGATVEEARKHADEHIGEVAEIAKEIRLGDGKSNGYRIQWTAMGLLFFGAFFYWSLTLFRKPDGSPIWEFWKFDPEIIGTVAIYLAGALFAFGVGKAKKLSVPALAVGLTMIAVGWMGTKIVTYKSLARYQSITTMLIQDRVSYPKVEQPKYNHRFDLLSACLNPKGANNRSNIEAFSAAMRDAKNIRGFSIPIEETGRWVYPTRLQKIMPARMPYLILASTDTYSVADQAWQSSNALRKALPAIKQAADGHFEEFASMPNPSNPALFGFLVEIGMCVIPFALSFLFCYLMFAIAINLKKLSRRNRPAQ